MSINTNSENPSIKEDPFLKDKFISDLSKSFLAWSDRNNFIDEIMNKDSIEDSDLLKRKIKAFKAYTSNVDFRKFDESQINIFDLKRSVWKEVSKLENSRQTYLEYTYSSYDLKEKQRNKLEKEIKNKSEVDLDKLMLNDKENNKFISKIFWDNKITKINNFWIFNSLTKEEIEKRLSRLSDEDRLVVEDAIFNLSNLTIKDYDIKNLFSTGFLTKHEKRDLISKFIPYVTLDKAIELNLISEIKAKKLKEDILTPFLKEKWLDSDLINKSIESASFSDLKINSNEFFKDDSNLNIISEWIWFFKLENSFNDARDDINKETWPENLKGLKQILSWEEFDWDFENLSDFKEWNFIKTITKTKEWTEQISYGKIVSVSDVNKNLNIRWIWDNSNWKEIINVDVQNIPETFSFSDILKNFKWEWKKASFYTETELIKIIENPKNNIIGSDLKQYTPKDLQENPDLTSTLQEKYNSNIEEQRQLLEEDIDKIESEIKTIKSNINNENKNESNSQISILEAKLWNRKARFTSLIKSSETNISSSVLLEEVNKIELIKKLDELDPDGKDIISNDWRQGIFKWMYIEWKWGVYEVSWVDEWKIYLNSKWKWWVAQPESFTFEQFYQAFKTNKAKRLSPIWSIEDFLQDNQENSEKKDIWNNFIVKNWELQIKNIPEYSKENSPEVEYLVSSESDEIYKIEDISWGEITFRIWERKKINNLDDKQKSKYKNNIKLWEDWKPEQNSDGSLKYEWELLSLSKNTETLSLVKFNKLINTKKEQFHPDWQTWKEKTISNPQDSENKFAGSFMTRLFNNLSLSEIYAGWKMMVENIEEYMKKWNEIHAAEVALKFWKILPDEVYQDLKIKIERAENESTDKEIEGLGKVDSWIAAERIKRWLTNKDTPEYKKEAWLLFMIKKYGHLTAKSALSKYKWKYLWYEAFGWKIWDKLFLDTKNEAEEKNWTFSEEYLMYKFIKKQCWKHWYAWTRRRTRLHKEYKAMWPQWVKDEIESGYGDASDERRARDMVDGWIWEMMWWTTSNAIWWFKKAIERWGSLEDMSEWFFTLLYSGAIYDLDQKSYLEIKKLWDWEEMPMIMARFSSYKSDMDLFNNTVLQISNRIWDEYGDEFPNIKSEAKNLFEDAQIWKWKEKDRLQRAQKFWKNYGTPLSRALNMNHVWESKYSKTDKILILERNSNPVFKEYFDKVRDFTTESTFKKDFMDDAMWMEWVAWLNTNEVIKKYFQLYNGWTIRNDDKPVVEKIWSKLSEDINSAWSKNFAWWDRDKRNYLKFMIQDIISWFVTNNWGNEYLAFYVKKSPFKDDMAKWWITEEILLKFNKFSSETILEWVDPDLNIILSWIVDTILSWTWSSNWESFKPWLDNVEKTKNKVKKTLPEDYI